MSKLINWIATHKLTAILLIIVGYFIYKSFLPEIITPTGMMRSVESQSGAFGAIANPMPDLAVKSVGSVGQIMPPTPIDNSAPTDTQNRLVIHDTDLSMVVDQVSQTITEIEALAKAAGGYLVNSSLSVPEGAATGYIVIRVPDTARQSTLASIEKLGVKVISENVTGTDVTDQYTDLDSRLATLNQTKTKFEDILKSAVKVQDILEVQREIINLEEQIDSLKGQQLYLSQSAKLTKITINLSTDELALPYTPDKGWRPAVIFKEAVRSLVGFFRQIGTALIWVVVFAAIWLPLLVIYLIVQRKIYKPHLS